jgi:hypothetical protein
MQEWNLPAAPGTVESLSTLGACTSDSSGLSGIPLAGTTDHEPRGVCFAGEHDRDAMCAEMESRGVIVAELEGVGPSARGRLCESVGDAIEKRLSLRGAGAPGITSGSDRDATLSDQLFRARRAGAHGIAVVLGPLRAATGPLGALEPEDCATLRFLADATRDRPITLVLDARDAMTGAYGDPVPLRLLLEGPPQAEGHLPPAQELAPEASLEPEPVLATETVPTTATATATATESAPEPDSDSDPEPPPPIARHTAGATVVEREEPWRSWTLQLAAARGPQPLATLERLFTESYMPLANAIAAGVDDARARHARDEFNATFSKGYTDAFATFASTTKRPRMVLDMHEVASRIGRLHGARSIRVLVVDAMRWDLSRLVEERLVGKLGARASLTDELLLWSALPTTTIRQLETLARGAEALRSPAALDDDPEPPRGRTAEYVRRMRVGPREIHKLDIVESRIRTLRGRIVEQLPELAEAAAEAIARHAETLSPRTLLFVTGDHGFTVDRAGGVHHGGASPEEVLVGAFALLVADVH